MRTDDLELAGEVIQDAAAYLGLADLESTAHFPTHILEFQAVMTKVSIRHVAPCIPAASASVWVSYRRAQHHKECLAYSPRLRYCKGMRVINHHRRTEDRHSHAQIDRLYAGC